MSASGSPATAAGGGRGARILLVEGNERDAAAINGSLVLHTGWEVTRAKTLLEAIRAAGEQSFDAAVLDTDLPDGSGIDILDFLRIGSPGIRILLLAEKPSESVAFHALSHGAGDFLVKDGHLEQELPRRIEHLLDHDVSAEAALIETLTPMTYEVRDAEPERVEKADEGLLGAALDTLVGGNTRAVGVFDIRGKPVGWKLDDDMDADGLGFAMGTLHGQVGGLWTYGNLKPTGYRMLVDVEGGILGITAIPGTFIVAVLFEEGLNPRRALERLDHVARAVLSALQPGDSGAPVG